MDSRRRIPICQAILAASALSFLFGCATSPSTPSPFTRENITALYKGMTTTEVQKLFGPPNSVRHTMCGRQERWQCEIWSYDRKGSRIVTNDFWFSVSNGRLLYTWDVTRAR